MSFLRWLGHSSLQSSLCERSDAELGSHSSRKPFCVILSEQSKPTVCRESNFFVRDPKRHFVPFDPRIARISTALRMTRTKKAQAKRSGIYKTARRRILAAMFACKLAVELARQVGEYPSAQNGQSRTPVPTKDTLHFLKNVL